MSVRALSHNNKNMSTRCQIGFYTKKPTKSQLLKPDALIYRHSDGYPEGVLPDLEPIVCEFALKRGLDDTEYASARVLQQLCNIYDSKMKEWGYEPDFLGYGICKVFHGDIEYYYAISPERIDIYETSIPWNQEVQGKHFRQITGSITLR